MNIKTLLKLFAPPLAISLWHSVSCKKYFHGMYRSFEDAPYENPWDKPYWIELAHKKLISAISSPQVTNVLPQNHPQDHTSLPCTIANILSATGSIKVLDFAGGTGFIYYKIRPFLLNPSKVTWDVVESSLPLIELAKVYTGKEKMVRYFPSLPSDQNIEYEMVYINTSLQYIPDYKSLFKSFFTLKPKFLVLTRLLAGECDTYVTSQDIGGLRTPCQIINFRELVEFLGANGYKLIYKSPCGENLENTFNSDIPESMQISYSLNTIFIKDNLN